MADWRGHGLTTPEVYRRMAAEELRGLSPSYEALCLGVSADAAVIARLDSLPGPKRQPNLLLAAVRFLDGPIADFAAFRSFVIDRWEDVAMTMLERRTQTNEAGRCAVLLPALAAAGRPLALLEVGAAAGLCLFWDRYEYRYSTTAGEHRLGASTAVLPCAVTGPAPLPGELPRVIWRAGLDLHPLDVCDDADVRWLECLVWPEHAERFARLRAAVDIARADPPHIATGDLLTDLPAVAAQAPAEATLVVFHSAVLAYLDAEVRAAFVRTVRDLAAARALVWLSNEAPAVVPGTDLGRDGPSRFVLARDGVPVALTQPHGSALTWLRP